MLWRAKIGGTEIVVATNDGPGGSCAGVRVDVLNARIGTPGVAIFQCFAQAISEGLERGVPLAAYRKTLASRRFEPNGPVEGDPFVEDCTSLVDYLVRSMSARHGGA